MADNDQQSKINDSRLMFNDTSDLCSFDPCPPAYVTLMDRSLI